MGDRRNVIITDGSDRPNVSLYTHWSGSELPEIVARALDRGRGRWGDTTYLTRIIFSEMIKDEVFGETGYGIEAVPGLTAYTESSPHDLVVDDRAQTVRIGKVTRSYEDFIKQFS